MSVGVCRLPIRVRYAETDRMGIVHHSRYLVYLEMGRTESLRQAGLTYRDLEDEGHFLVVASLSCRFRAPARYDDVITVETSVERVTQTRIEHAYRIMRDADSALILEAATTLCCVDGEGALQRIPEKILQAVERACAGGDAGGKGS